jgi:hypothetical protein
MIAEDFFAPIHKSRVRFSSIQQSQNDMNSRKCSGLFHRKSNAFMLADLFSFALYWIRVSIKAGETV